MTELHVNLELRPAGVFAHSLKNELATMQRMPPPWPETSAEKPRLKGMVKSKAFIPDVLWAAF